MFFGPGSGRAALAAAVTAIAVTACGDGDDGDRSTPSAADIPPGAVAIAGDEAISMRQLDRRVASLRRGGADGSRHALRDQALSQLLRAAWLEQEAADLDIDVRDKAVRERLDQAKGRLSKREYRSVLGRQTEADLLYELRQQELSERIYERARRQGTSQQRAVREFSERWRARTVCRARYAVANCDAASR